MRKFLFIILSALICGLLIAAPPHGLTNRNLARIAASAGGGAGGGNLLINGGFETYAGTQDDGISDTFTGWTVYQDLAQGSFVEASATAQAGTNGLRVTRGTGLTGVSQIIAVTPGANLTLSFYCQGDGATSQGHYSVIDETNGQADITNADTGVTAASWTLVTVPFTVPVGCVSISVYLWVGIGFTLAQFDSADLQ